MSKELDPFVQTVERLRREREELDRTIAFLEARISGNSSPPRAEAGAETHTESDQAEETGVPSHSGQEGEFLGMKVAEAARIVLERRRKPMRPADITADLRDGGLLLSSPNTVASVLHRRSKDVGDFVSPKRGVWGLKEWYPGRVFVRMGGSSRGSAKQEASAESATEPSEHGQPSETTPPVRLRSVGEP